MKEFGAMLIGISVVFLIIAIGGFKLSKQKDEWLKVVVIALICNLISICMCIPLV